MKLYVVGLLIVIAGASHVSGDKIVGASFINRMSGHECYSSDEKLGKFATVQQCADACANTHGCYFFDFGTNSKDGWCYWEKTQGDLEHGFCPEGYQSDKYDFYELTGKSHSDWTLVKANHECGSGDESLKWGVDSVDDCADLCRNKVGCNFFDFGYGAGWGGKKGRCYMEYTKSAACTEGFQPDKYYFYALNRCEDSLPAEVAKYCPEFTSCASVKSHCNGGTWSSCAPSTPGFIKDSCKATCGNC